MNDTASPQRAPEIGKRVAGLLDSSLSRRFGGHALLLAVSFVVIWVGRVNVMGVLPAQMDVSALAGMGEAVPTATPVAGLVSVSSLGAVSESADITRITDIHTYIPDRARFEISSYDVQAGDTILGIAEKFGLTPETIVFGNPILRDNPHFLAPGQTLRIAPGNGIIRDVIDGDTLGGLARVYGVTPEDIINWPSNNIDPENPQISVGQIVFVPGGTRGLLSFPESELAVAAGTSSGSTSGSSGGGGGTTVQRTEPWVLRSGVGQCAVGSAGGVVGSGTFIYLTHAHFISGYDYGPIHPGIDLDGEVGAPVFASDSGVIVFAGWSEWGYGNTIVIAHGNGWWTLYGHLSGIFVSCGQGVYQGGQIGAIGNTGSSQGAHLHFEVYGGVYQTNPWGVLP